MLKTIIQIAAVWLLTALPSFLFASQASDQDWKLEKDKKGIKVYTRHLDGEKYRETKAIVVFRAEAEAVLDMIFDYTTYTDWVPRSMEAKAVEKSDNVIISYTLNDAPWPVSDRDIVVRNTISRLIDGSIRIDMVGIESDIPTRSDAVRMTYFKGYWLLTPLGDGRLRVTYQAVMDPEGSIPAWVVNIAVEDTPYELLQQLRDQFAD